MRVSLQHVQKQVENSESISKQHTCKRLYPQVRITGSVASIVYEKEINRTAQTLSQLQPIEPSHN